MKLRSGKVVGSVMKEEIKSLIQDDLKQLKDGITDKPTYDYIITSLLDIYTKHLASADVLDSLEKDIKYLADDENSEIWGYVYSLSTLIKGSHPVLGFAYYDDDFNNNEELKTEVIGEISRFIQDNI